jgi:uncharacterized protein YciI
MQFLVIGHDGTDDQALSRRMTAREAHLAGVVKMKEEGKAIFGTAILDDQGNMIGSVMVMDFPSREELDTWLNIEPYVKGDVWLRIEVLPTQVPPIFMPPEQ